MPFSLRIVGFRHHSSDDNKNNKKKKKGSKKSHKSSAKTCFSSDGSFPKTLQSAPNCSIAREHPFSGFDNHNTSTTTTPRTLRTDEEENDDGSLSIYSYSGAIHGSSRRHPRLFFFHPPGSSSSNKKKKTNNSSNNPLFRWNKLQNEDDDVDEVQMQQQQVAESRPPESAPPVVLLRKPSLTMSKNHNNTKNTTTSDAAAAAASKQLFFLRRPPSKVDPDRRPGPVDLDDDHDDNDACGDGDYLDHNNVHRKEERNGCDDDDGAKTSSSRMTWQHLELDVLVQQIVDDDDDDDDNNNDPPAATTTTAAALSEEEVETVAVVDEIAAQEHEQAHTAQQSCGDDLVEQLFGSGRSLEEEEVFFEATTTTTDKEEEDHVVPDQDQDLDAANGSIVPRTTTPKPQQQQPTIIRRRPTATPLSSWTPTLPPRTPGGAEQHQVPLSTKPVTPNQQVQQPSPSGSKQRFRLSPSFKEIICQYHTPKSSSSKKRLQRRRHHYRRRDDNVSPLSGCSSASQGNDCTSSPSMRSNSQSSSSVFSDISSLSGAFENNNNNKKNGTAAATAPSSSFGQQPSLLLPPRTNYHGSLADEGCHPLAHPLAPPTLTSRPSISKLSMEFPINTEVADEHVSSQMIAMGKELLKQFMPTAAAVESTSVQNFKEGAMPPSKIDNTGNDEDVVASPLLSSRITKALFFSSATPLSSKSTSQQNVTNKKVLILIMDPSRRIFEVVPASLPTSDSSVVCTVGDLLSQIPYQATDYRLKFQEYTGISQGGEHLMRSHILPRDMLQTTTSLDCKHENDAINTPLFAIPSHFMAGQIELFASTLLQNPKVVRMIHDHQVLWGIH